MPWLIRRRNDQFCIYKEGANGEPTGDSLGCHDSESAAEQQRRALEANVNEMADSNPLTISGAMSDVLVISELKGRYPNVPIASDVDYTALVEGDEKPRFITLPIGKVNVKSGNHRYYDQEWIQELERQVLGKKPIGLMGHLAPNERSWAMPKEAVHWVGALFEQDTGLLWGKAYVPPGDERLRIQRYTASGKSIATSIACGPKTEGVWDESLKAYRMRAATMELEQIDIAPADRAGIPDLAMVPLMTREMEQDNEHDDKEPEVDKYQVIREMTAEDAKLLPDAVRETILASKPEPETPPEVGIVQELREALGVDDKTDLAQLVTELRQAEATRKQDAIKQRITELVTDEETGVKVEAMRGMVTELVTARNPQTPDEAEAAYKQVTEMEAVKTALAGHVQKTMGPPQRTPVQRRQEQGGRYFQIPSREA